MATYFSSIGVIQASIKAIENKFKTAKARGKAVEKRFEQNNEDFNSQEAPFLIEPFIDSFGELDVRVTNQKGKVFNLGLNSI